MKQILALTLALSFAFIGCTQNQRARNYGGTLTVELPANQKLENATWKDANLWYLTRPMRAGEVAETYTFHESSNFGINQGTILFKENKR